MFEWRKRRKAAERRFDKAIAAEWARRGVVPRDSSGPAFREAVCEAGLGSPGDPVHATSLDVIAAAKERLLEEDRFIVTGGREGQEPSRGKPRSFAE